MYIYNLLNCLSKKIDGYFSVISKNKTVEKRKTVENKWPSLKQELRAK